MDKKIWEILNRSLETFTQNIIDKYIETNVSIRSRSGIKSFIIRRELGRCCDWCRSVAGIYEYGDEPRDVYMRHDNCRCLVTFKNEKGYTDVWSKNEFKTQREARISIEERLLQINETILSYTGAPVRYEHIEKEYLSKSHRLIGSVRDERESRKNPEEITFAEWINRVFGGNIVRLIEKDDQLNPDYEWNGKLWDLKSPRTSKYNTLDHRICKGLEQIELNPGGLMLDFSNSKLDYETAKRYSVQILDSKAKRTTDVIIKKDEKFCVLRVIKSD